MINYEIFQQLALDKKRFFHYSISQNNGWEKEEYATGAHREKHPWL